MHQAFRHLENGMCLLTPEDLCQDTPTSGREPLLALESTLSLVPDHRHPQPTAPRITLHLLQETYCLLAPGRSPRPPRRAAARTPPRP